jgi:hypothetical protein
MTRFIRSTALALAMMPTSAMSQDMLPLEELIDDAAPSYTPTRCAALYQAIMEWGGEQQLGTDLWQRTESDREYMALMAVIMLQDRIGGSVEDISMVVARDIRNIADIYLERLEHNFATSGQAFNTDPVMRGDISVCRLFEDIMQNGQ